ncbi:hypothetical protein CEUSTIGMA_g2822.t1 [Chlamydomonas eustigma]|uniref:Uncharacterized protein n=1 Tax=Chlamydomonas eustigma TaxID=1157962 RepID=A0A250WX06_9CHLO|nr:hypothetical protein CEUSTIGMA_g2822.t1 [Chlamydomonas eustigma]|eukprot:GAX75378.1 hypothetical protein CEUSTIGMA_g2822.t1 [Chlamydomonas eustigma]
MSISDVKVNQLVEEEDLITAEEVERIRAENVKALVSNSLQTERLPVMSKFLTLHENGERKLKRPFLSPVPGAPAVSQAMKQKLAARKMFVPWGENKPLLLRRPTLPEFEHVPDVPLEVVESLPEGIEPLLLWSPPPDIEGAPIFVDNMLVRWLRPHQREGVAFMFECVTGQRLEGGQGCILADDMGLGKTLQGITLLWTLVQNGHQSLGGSPIAHRAIIVCPTSLVSNWDSECTKWLKGRLTTMALCEASRDDVLSGIDSFLRPANLIKVLIISYETFRLHAERLQVPGACDLLICDEAHRLKNDATLTNKALGALPCKRRVLLSGTPLQNHLDEFYAMVDFCNPGVLGTPQQFRRTYEAPILAGREPGASPEIEAQGQTRSAELSALVNVFILRRTNALLSQHLPPKVIEVVCCRLTALQQLLYDHFLHSKATRKLLNGKGTAGVLSAITSLKKLCNHPKLIYDMVHSSAYPDKSAGESEKELDAGFKNVEELFPPGVFDCGRSGRGGMALGWELLSGKMAVLSRMLQALRTDTRDRIVVVSNYTQTLDLVSQLCRERQYPFLRLDGSTSISKREKLVKAFNDPLDNQFVFLLSSKAGGCGLNLIGGNRLILFDPDWNPATDKQAAARVWRDGQKKHVYVYRFLSTGSIEEKIFQRQLSKEGLQSLVSKNGKATAAVMSAEELRELFTLDRLTLSNTYDSMCQHQQMPDGLIEALLGNGAGQEHDVASATAAGSDYALGSCCKGGAQDTSERLQESASSSSLQMQLQALAIAKKQEGSPSEDDLQGWGHHSNVCTVPDLIMQRVAGEDVSFIFTCEIAGKLPEPQPNAPEASRPPPRPLGNLHLRRSAPRGDPHSTVNAIPATPSDIELENQHPNDISTNTKKSEPLKVHEHNLLSHKAAFASKAYGDGSGHASGDSSKENLLLKSDGRRGNDVSQRAMDDRGNKKLRAVKTIVEILDDSDVSDDFQ